MSLQQVNFQGLNKIEVSIKRCQEHEPPEGYYFADSYGKDSCAVDRILDMSGVKHDAHYSKGGLDPLELVRFGNEYHPDTIVEHPEISVWEGIQKKGMPRRQSRWCCELIKEKHGAGRVVVTGIRWAESPRRALRKIFEVSKYDPTKHFLNPIIDWTTSDVWDFIHQQQIPYSMLYEERFHGRKVFKRLGCVLCPMETRRQTLFELNRFPDLAEAWHKSCIKYWEKGNEGTKRWKSGEEMWQWWLSRERGVQGHQCLDMFKGFSFDN
jgi:phosphoadenosine phosphosulfate reductase